jgi:hypothetical protein
LTKVAGNELGDCLDSEIENEEENPYQGFYSNPLVSETPPTIHVDVSEATVSTYYDDDYVAYAEHTFADGEVESHHVSC